MSNPGKRRVINRNRTLKVTVVGDSQVGKTCLLLTYVTKKYPACVPASFEWHLAGTGFSQSTYPNIQVDGQRYDLDFTDTLGLDSSLSLRLLKYMTTDVFVVCFDISCPESFENVREKWMPEIRTAQPEIPIIIVGTKLDLRNNSDVKSGLAEVGKKPVLHEEGQRLARELKVVDYVECSSLNNDGVRSVFLTAAHAACMAKKSRVGGCESAKDEECCTCVIL
ncbi:ras-like GTP-binding protein RHO [Haliotis asinina]|uniref:ras-like GTP-binding protein RHO n=1 Tax=Haliotis asinina TaxID=109174 RepID=UPI003532325C